MRAPTKTVAVSPIDFSGFDNDVEDMRLRTAESISSILNSLTTKTGSYVGLDTYDCNPDAKCIEKAEIELTLDALREQVIKLSAENQHKLYRWMHDALDCRME